MPADWQAVALPRGVRETMVVQASPRPKDNQRVLDLAVGENSILGFVRNLDRGRFRVTPSEPYRVEFATPSLRDVAMTAHY